MTRPCTFVSGHMDLTLEEFRAHYEPELHRRVQARHTFVCGDAPGCDHMVQRWFEDHFPLGGAPLTVYHMLERPRPHKELYSSPFLDAPVEFDVSVYPLVGGFTSDVARDEAMTLASDEDLAWVRQTSKGRRSGTQTNINRRLLLEAERRRLQRACWPRVHLDEYYADPYNELRLYIRDEPGRYTVSVPIRPGLAEEYSRAHEALQQARSRWEDVQAELRQAFREERDEPTRPSPNNKEGRED